MITEHLLFAESKANVTATLSLARSNHTVVSEHIAADPDHISWVVYRFLDDVFRLVYYPHDGTE
jgi:hypothetical protein